MRDSPLIDWFGCRYIGWERWLPYGIVIIGSSLDGPPYCEYYYEYLFDLYSKGL